jgi:hypothetical protein
LIRQTSGLPVVRGGPGEQRAAPIYLQGGLQMKKTKLTSMLAVMGGLSLATGACSGACSAATCAPAAEEAAGETAAAECGAAPCAAAADCGAAACEAKPCAAADCAAKAE